MKTIINAQIKLYESCRTALIRKALSIVNDRNDAEDIVQEAFLLALAHGDFKSPAQGNRWLFAVVHNKAVNYIRELKRQSVICSKIIRMPERIITSIKPERLSYLQWAIQRLSPRLKDVMLLREIKHKSYHTIACQLNIELGTVRSRLSNGRKKCKQLMGPWQNQGINRQ